jgi:hypothetical protein
MSEVTALDLPAQYSSAIINRIPVPDQLAIPVYFPDSMQRYGVFFTHVVNQLEVEMIFAVEKELFQRDLDDVFFEAIVVTDDKLCTAEILIPLNPVQ